AARGRKPFDKIVDCAQRLLKLHFSRRVRCHKLWRWLLVGQQFEAELCLLSTKRLAKRTDVARPGKTVAVLPASIGGQTHARLLCDLLLCEPSEAQLPQTVRILRSGPGYASVRPV